MFRCRSLSISSDWSLMRMTNRWERSKSSDSRFAVSTSPSVGSLSLSLSCGDSLSVSRQQIWSCLHLCRRKTRCIHSPAQLIAPGCSPAPLLHLFSKRDAHSGKTWCACSRLCCINSQNWLLLSTSLRDSADTTWKLIKLVSATYFSGSWKPAGEECLNRGRHHRHWKDNEKAAQHPQ